jgi:hypothetical protein
MVLTMFRHQVLSDTSWSSAAIVFHETKGLPFVIHLVNFIEVTNYRIDRLQMTTEPSESDQRKLK